MFGERHDNVDVVRGSETITPEENGIARSVSVWVEALHDIGSLGDALTSVLRLSRADRALLLRFDTIGRRSRRIASVNGGQSTSSTHGSGFADDLLAASGGAMRPGDVWRYSVMKGQPGFRDNRALRNWIKEQSASEIILIVLDCNDLLELHFSEAPNQNEAARIEKMGEVLSRSWRHRQSGLVARHLARRCAPANSSTGDFCGVNILDASNPANLSRCEYRVCHLLSLGLSVARISEELGVTKSTARTHLRHIYAKTGASGQMELLYFLLSSGQNSGGITRLTA